MAYCMRYNVALSLLETTFSQRVFRSDMAMGESEMFGFWWVGLGEKSVLVIGNEISQK
jgi:hypothetical protein